MTSLCSTLTEFASEAKPCLLMLPGLDGSGRLFDPLLQALGPQWPTLVMSYPPNASGGYIELQGWLEAQLPPQTPLFILAESFSGPLAVELAAQRPQQVRGVMLCCTFASNPRPGLRWAGGFLPWLPVATRPSWPVLRLLMGRYGTAGARRQMVDVVSGLPADLVRARLAAVLTVDVRAMLARVTQPVWLLQASDDALVPPAAIQVLSGGLPTSRLTTLQGPHALLQACPEAAAVVLRDAWHHCFADFTVESSPS
jgi:pimeloyl-ACP methyl ester carboxylesterase